MSHWYATPNLTPDTGESPFRAHLEVLGGVPAAANTLGVTMLRQYVYLETMLRTRRNERGATAVEYGLMVALIAVAIIVTVGLLGGKLDTLFAKVTSSL